MCVQHPFVTSELTHRLMIQLLEKAYKTHVSEPESLPDEDEVILNVPQRIASRKTDVRPNRPKSEADSKMHLNCLAASWMRLI